MNFTDYQLKDFIQDESFQNWVNKTTPDDVWQWQVWIKNNPDKKQIVAEAAAIIKGIDFKKNQVSSNRIDEQWFKLNQALSGHEHITNDQVKKSVKWLNLAALWAGIILVAAVGGVYFYKQNNGRYYKTGYGETLTIMLPDKSTVVLNSNSSLKLAPTWDNTHHREVWLKGEAFFSVLKKAGQGNARFLVHLNDIEVNVLGTKFNVTSRQTCTRLVLASGKVQLQNQVEKAGLQSIVLKPGEMAELTPDKKSILKKKVNPAVYSAWIHKKLIFDDTSISDIASLLENNYGFKVKLNDPALINRKLTGEIYVEDVETLLNALSKSFKLTLTQNANVITISSTPTKQ